MIASAFLILLAFLPETAYRRTAASSRGVHFDKSAGDVASEKEHALSKTSVVQSVDTTIDLIGRGAPSKVQRFGFFAGRDSTYKPFNALLRVFQTAYIGPVWIAVGWFGAAKGILVGQVIFFSSACTA